MIDILINPDDPDFQKNAETFFRINYNELCALDDECRRHLAKTTAPKPTASTDRSTIRSLSIDNYPETAIDSEGMRYLLTKRHEFREDLLKPLRPARNGREAAQLALRQRLRLLANEYLYRVLRLLLLDERLYPESPYKIDARRLADPDIWEMKSYHDSLPKLAYLCNVVYSDLPPNAVFARELNELIFIGELFFDVFDTVFNLTAIRKCRMAFNLLVCELGTKNGFDKEANYSRRQKTMYLELLKWKENGGALTKSDIETIVSKHVDERLPAIEAAVADNTRAITNMDRRQKAFIKWLKDLLTRFVRLFRPGTPVPTREKVAAALSPNNRYACLQRIKEPHRSQIKAVIDYTIKHPIDHDGKGKNRKNAFTLSQAVAAVWRQSEAAWSKAPGTFATTKDLQSACYNLREKSDDPFRYRA